MKHIKITALALCISSISQILCYEIPKGLKIHKTLPTLNAILDIVNKKEKGVYFRFGDGDVIIAHNGSGTCDLFHPNQKLMIEMREAFGINGKNVLKTLPLYSRQIGGWEPGMSLPAVHEMHYVDCLTMLRLTEPYWGAPITDTYSHVALAHGAVMHPEFTANFLKELRKHPIILVGHSGMPKNVRDVLFGEKHIFIPTRPTDAHLDLDQIEQSCLQAAAKIKEYYIIVACLGNTSRILHKRLWPKLDNTFLFDFGSLMDALCGWNGARWWINASGFNRDRFLNLMRS